ncbi:succinate dehydrogenase assembly factor 2 [Enterovirga rhinocerotis]|uniref:FAD assembly factor SdhE n=1 Tax=Enterovirga rhinocerotis TaxID=1339210 RepID=A0A4R7C7G3_9HYPH|nr:succinate dehydrogenase assembly factor 2 [Enterovirga rhinocerotis]TDR94580.1 antitoxin CptB [Enterovirga rhinocerotis]
MSAPRDTAAAAALDPRRKRALFRAWHRGMREMDLVMGRFADREMAGLSEAELDEFEALMDLPDPQVFAWIAEQETPPGERDTPLLGRLRAFRAG